MTPSLETTNLGQVFALRNALATAINCNLLSFVEQSTCVLRMVAMELRQVC